MTDNEKDVFSQRWQMALGSFLMIGFFAFDAWDGTLSGDPSKTQLIVAGVRYAVAFILIKGVSVAEITELVRAWRAK